MTNYKNNGTGCAVEIPTAGQIFLAVCVIVKAQAKWYAYSKARRVGKGAFKALGIVGYTDYDFRSTFGTQLKESGKTSAEVADLMGHADTRMVETVYARTRHEGVMKHLKFIEEMNTRVS